VRDVRIAEKGGGQFNRISFEQLQELGLGHEAVRHRVTRGYLTPVHPGVYAVAPVDHRDDWGKWMGAVLTSPQSVLSHVSAAAAGGFWTPTRTFETITRPGSGGPRRFGAVLVHRSTTLPGDTTTFRGIPLTKAPRTILDLAPHISAKALARCLREAVRLERTTIAELADYTARNRSRRHSRAVRAAIVRYSGLPIERARSGAEVRAMELLRDAGRLLPTLNVRRAGEEADLSWPLLRLIVELDGGPFHLDVGEDARKQAVWEAAGWEVLRLDADDVYEKPGRLLAIAPTANVPSKGPWAR